LEKLNDKEKINSAWENIKDNTKTSANGCLGLYELRQYKTCFVEEFSRFLEEMKQALLQWLQDPSHSKEDIETT